MVLGHSDAVHGESHSVGSPWVLGSSLDNSHFQEGEPSNMTDPTISSSDMTQISEENGNSDIPSAPTSGETIRTVFKNPCLANLNDSTFVDLTPIVDNQECLLSSRHDLDFGETLAPVAPVSQDQIPVPPDTYEDPYDNPQYTDTISSVNSQTPLLTYSSDSSLEDQPEVFAAPGHAEVDQITVVSNVDQMDNPVYSGMANNGMPLVVIEGEEEVERPSELDALSVLDGKADVPCSGGSLMDLLQGNMDLLNPYGILIESIETVRDDDDDDEGTSRDRPSAFQSLLELSTYVEGMSGGMAECTVLNQACQQALIYSSQMQLPGNDKAKSLLSLHDFSPLPHKLNVVPSNKHLRNLLWLSIAITMMFIALGSVRNLQSSINHEGGVGLISLAVSAVGFLICSLFSSVVVQCLHPRLSIILCLVPHLLYVAANLYPVLWVMVLASLLQGAALAILWNASSTYITFLARGRAEKKQEHIEHVTSRYFGLFCLIYQLSYIIGNLIASLVLMLGSTQAADVSSLAVNSSAMVNGSTGVFYALNDSASRVVLEEDGAVNATSQLHLCGTAYCHHYTIDSMTTGVNDFSKNLLFGIYMGFVVIAILIAVFFLEPLNHSLLPKVQSWKQLGGQLTDLARFLTNGKFLLLVPLLFYANLQLSFFSAEVVKAFVTCALGIHMVGYTMICMAISGCVSSYVSGLLNKVVGRIPLICLAGILNLGLLVFLSLWQPGTDSLYPYFLVFGIWGFSDGIFLSQLNSIIPVVFPEKFEEAYTGMRVAQGLAVVVMMFSAQSMCMACKTYIVAGLCFFALLCYSILEIILRREKHTLKTLVTIVVEE